MVRSRKPSYVTLFLKQQVSAQDTTRAFARVEWRTNPESQDFRREPGRTTRHRERRQPSIRAGRRKSVRENRTSTGRRTPTAAATREKDLLTSSSVFRWLDLSSVSRGRWSRGQYPYMGRIYRGVGTRSARNNLCRNHWKPQTLVKNVCPCMRGESITRFALHTSPKTELFDTFQMQKLLTLQKTMKFLKNPPFLKAEKPY